MAAIGTLTVYDGASIPVAHTLDAVSVAIDKNVHVAVWRENLTTVPTDANISVTLSKKKLPSGVNQVEMVTNVPVMESISGQNSAGYTAAPKVAYVDTFKTINFQHPRSTALSRRIARQIHANLSAHVATSVAPSTVGPMQQAFDNQIMPT